MGRACSPEPAIKMQASVSELVDLSGEPRHVLDRYGTEVIA